MSDEVIVSYGDRRYRTRSLAKNLSCETLKINLHIAQGDAYYVDTFDLYSARARHLYIVNAAKELGVREEIIKADLGRLLLKLEALQQARIEAAVKVESQVPAMTEAEREQALELLRDPQLLDRLLHAQTHPARLTRTGEMLLDSLAAADVLPAEVLDTS